MIVGDLAESTMSYAANLQNIVHQQQLLLKAASAPPRQEETTPTSATSSVTKALVHDAKSDADALATLVKTSSHGKFDATASEKINELFKNIRNILDNPLNDQEKDLSLAQKKRVAKYLVSVLTDKIAETFDGSAIDAACVRGLLLFEDFHSVTMLFRFTKFGKANGTASGGQRKKVLKSVNTSDATVFERSQLWDQLTEQQARNATNVTYTGAQFTAALRFWKVFWFFLCTDVWFALNSFVTRLNILTITTFGFHLAHAHPGRHARFLNAVYMLMDELVAYSKNFAADDFEPQHLNPFENVRALQLESNTLPPKLKTRTMALLTAMRESATAYRAPSDLGTMLNDTDGHTAIVDEDGLLVIHNHRPVTPCADFSHGHTTCKAATTSHKIGNSDYVGHEVKGRLYIHKRI